MRHQTAIAAAFLSAFALAAAAAPSPSAKNATQVFQKNHQGGIQQVTAKDPKDADLIAAIRAKLEAEAQRFGDGDYGKVPEAKYLKAVKPSQITIIYRNLPAGAAIDYEGNDAAGVDAIHKWLDAEISTQE